MTHTWRLILSKSEVIVYVFIAYTVEYATYINMLVIATLSTSNYG